ncbi:MAG: glucose dehydrogenase, partial [Candidatus Rokuibacteriota bacterium]
MTALTPRLGLASAAVIAVSGGILACGGADRAPDADGSADTAATAATGSAADTVTVPEGSRATIFADTLGQARHLATRPNGDVYVNTWRSPYDSARRVPPGGFLVALRDTNRDGMADRIQRFGGEGGNGGTGIAFFKDALYAEAGPSILRYRMKPGELAPGAAPDTIVSGLPVEGGHPMHPFAIDFEGNL